VKGIEKSDKVCNILSIIGKSIATAMGRTAITVKMWRKDAILAT
jgi:hypothetical protein